jgi:hypothetical protein
MRIHDPLDAIRSTTPLRFRRAMLKTERRERGEKTVLAAISRLRHRQADAPHRDVRQLRQSLDHVVAQYPHPLGKVEATHGSPR